MTIDNKRKKLVKKKGSVINPGNGTISFIAKNIICELLGYSESTLPAIFSKNGKKLSNYKDIAEFIHAKYPGKKRVVAKKQ